MDRLTKIATVVLLFNATALVTAFRCPSEGTCVVQLVVEPRLTMMNGRVRVRPCGGSLCEYDKNEKVHPSIADNIITTDAVYARLVFSVNGTIPGPEIIVYEDQDLEVYVTNNLHTDSTTIHFHGIHQVKTPFMDGVAYVTQCPILPGNTFRYAFKATPHGTHWYHAHIGDQRSMGLYGPLIVLRKNEPSEYVDKHIITIQDWNHDMDPETAYQKMLNGIYDCSLNGDSCTRYQNTGAVDGSKFSVFQFHSGLINGRGRYHTSRAVHNDAPLTQYLVDPGQLYRFRVISAATLYPFRVYVSGHKMTIIASDGREIEPLEVESFVIHTGERMDFIINTTNQNQNYMIFAETLEVLSTDLFHGAEAILSYRNASGSPLTAPVPCSNFPGGTCPVFNCPFVYYPEVDLRTCITFHDVRAKVEEVPDNYQSILSSVADKTFFLNFAFPGIPGNTPGSVNGRQFVEPKVNAYAQPREVEGSCSDKDCGRQKICSCTHTIDIEEGQIIDLVFLNMGIGKGFSHPVHLHGHSFYVVAVGFPDYNIRNGTIVKQNPAIDCRGSYCNNAIWTGRGRKRRQTEDEQDRIPPLKDTIIVPSGGYVIARFKADNPGLWFLHCHIDLHNTNGMAMVVNESFAKQPLTPRNVPRCRDYLNDNFNIFVGRGSGFCPNVLHTLMCTIIIFFVIKRWY